MKHEEYVEKVRKRAALVANGMLDGSIHYLEGAIELSSLSFDVCLHEDNQGFDVFQGISSETDHLPIGPARQYWSQEALDRHEPEIQKAIDWAKEISLSERLSISKRFSV